MLRAVFRLLISISFSYLAVFGTAAASQAAAVKEKPKPFTAESNFMSELGYARWSYYQNYGKWPKLTENEYLEAEGMYADPGLPAVVWALNDMIERNPVAKEYVVSWQIDRWGAEWHDYYSGEWIYKPLQKKLTKFIDNTPKETRFLDRNLLIQLKAKWNDLFKKPDGSKEWYSWWESQN